MLYNLLPLFRTLSTFVQVKQFYTRTTLFGEKVTSDGLRAGIST